jgi:hypothetical protein
LGVNDLSTSKPTTGQRYQRFIRCGSAKPVANYYDESLSYLSPDPADPSVTQRVITTEWGRWELTSHEIEIPMPIPHPS